MPSAGRAIRASSASVAAIASVSAAPFATPASPRATSAITPSAWLFANDSARTITTRGAEECEAIRAIASRRRRVLPMPGAPVSVTMIGV